MSSGETELTFIRCPSCRSLVPAMAARCRMCGHLLASASAAPSPNTAPEEPHHEEGRHRVRQQSEVISADTVEEIQAQVAEQAASEPEEETSVPEVFAAPEESSEAAEAESFSTPAEPEDDYDVDAVSEDEELEADEQDSASGPAFGSDEPRRRRRKRRRRKRGHQEDQRESVSDVPENFPVSTGSESVDLLASELGEPEQREAIQEVAAQVVAQPETQETHKRLDEKEQVMTQRGTLLGWFVSFSQDPRGVAREIRSGQCFLGRQRLRNSDIVLQDDSVSTPHALLRATDDQGLVIQDLMSERGTFIKRANSDNFNQCYDTSPVQHGDWLRFGNYEVLVCLLPRMQRKG